jgi:tRNA A37 threonylcarbamoyladenosine dehydratase
MDHICTYRNNRYHDNTNQQVARYKTEALDRRYEEIWAKHAGLVERLHAFQTIFLGQKKHREYKL